MARTVASEHIITRPWQAWLRTVLIGAGVGLAVWCLTIVLTRYVVEPLTCRDLTDAAACVGAQGLAGNIALILAAVGAVFMMVRFNVVQPLIVAIGSAAILWDIAAWTLGLVWVEALAWNVLLFALAYGLFAWLTRYPRTVVVLVVSLIVVVAVRIALAL